MKKYVGITDKRMRDKRFRRTEEAILKIAIDGNFCVGVNELAKRIGVARSTIYSHHRTAREIVPDYKQYLMGKYDQMFKRVLEKEEIDLKDAIRCVFIFIIQNKRFFVILKRCGDKELYERMIMQLRSKMIWKLNLPKNSDRIYKVFKSEAVELLSEWAEEDFREERIGILLINIVDLAKTMRTRLRFLLEN